MNARPAGMSDEESDEEGFDFHDEFDRRRHNNYYTNEREVNGQINFDEVPMNAEKEKQKLEFNALEACMSGSIVVIEEYLASGRKVDEFLHSGWTLLLYAASAAQTHIVKYLLELGADPNLYTDGYTPLMALSNCPRGTNQNCLDCLKLLLEFKVNTHAMGKRRETALMLACKMREPDFVRELIRNMRSVNAADSEDQTAIFYAVKANREEIVQILMEHNADITIKDQFGESPYDIAKTKGFDKIVALLDIEENDGCPVSDSLHMISWMDMFPSLASNNENKLNFDVATILYGMGLDTYKELFLGVDLKTFLKLTEEDLEKLGMDISIHRKKFLRDLHKFHAKEWNLNSLGAIKKSLPYTIYDGVVTLGNAAKQISTIGSSFRFIVNNLMRGQQENLELSLMQKVEYASELQKTEISLINLKNEIRDVKKLAKKIDKESEIIFPATYIGKKKKTYKWTIVLSLSAMLAIYLSKSRISKLLDH